MFRFLLLAIVAIVLIEVVGNFADAFNLLKLLISH